MFISYISDLCPPVNAVAIRIRRVNGSQSKPPGDRVIMVTRQILTGYPKNS
jgi:hypothetical protein